VRNEALERLEVQAFVRYYLENIDQVAELARFIPPSDEQKQEALATFEEAVG
jgi:hypothetical protein